MNAKETLIALRVTPQEFRALNDRAMRVECLCNNSTRNEKFFDYVRSLVHLVNYDKRAARSGNPRKSYYIAMKQVDKRFEAISTPIRKAGLRVDICLNTVAKDSVQVSFRTSRTTKLVLTLPMNVKPEIDFQNTHVIFDKTELITNSYGAIYAVRAFNLLGGDKVKDYYAYQVKGGRIVMARGLPSAKRDLQAAFLKNFERMAGL